MTWATVSAGVGRSTLTVTWATVSAGVRRSTLTVTWVTVSGRCRGWEEYTHGDVGDRKFCEERVWRGV